jgi:two-component system, OmpR family, response regulator VicR
LSGVGLKVLHTFNPTPDKLKHTQIFSCLIISLCGKLILTQVRIAMKEQNGRRIIYIEDDQEMIDLVMLILNRRGYNVQGAHGGRVGLDMVLKDPPDLVLLDLMMPGIDGWEVYQQIKANENTRNIPVIIVTAKAQAIDRVLGLHIAKVDDYIAKPFRPQELVDSIENVLARASQQNP